MRPVLGSRKSLQSLPSAKMLLVSSLFSTTGYVNKGWEFSSGISAIALLLLATGGMAGSPGSGFGVHRLIELIKYLRRELTRKYNRQAIRKIKLAVKW